MTTPYSQLTHEQLLSAITERDEQLRNCMDKIRDTINESVPKKDYVEQQKQLRVALVEVAKVNGFRYDLQRKYQTLRDKYSEACSHLESSQERCKHLEGDVLTAKHMLEGNRQFTLKVQNDITTHKTVLKECVVCLQECLPMTQIRSDPLLWMVGEAITHATKLLENTEPQNQ